MEKVLLQNNIKGLPTKLAWFPIPVILVAALVLWSLHTRTFYDSLYLLVSLNFMFSTLISLFVTFLVSRSFLLQGRPGLLFLGCGVLFWGWGGFIGSAAAIKVFPLANQLNINIAVTIHNLCMFLSALCHLSGSLLSLRSRSHQRISAAWLITAYLVVICAVGSITFLSTSGMTPIFFVQGQGGTPLRQFVLSCSISMFIGTAILMFQLYRRMASRFIYWYSLSLVLVAEGLLCILIQTVHAGPLGWLGRSVQYLGSIYMLIAAIASVLESGAWRISLETALNDARQQFEGLFDLAEDGILVHELYDEGVYGKFIQANPAICRMLGYREQELLQLGMLQIVSPEDRQFPEQEAENLRRSGKLRHEKTLLSKYGRSFPTEINTRLFQQKGRNMVMSVIRDLSERKSAETALQNSFQRLDLLAFTANRLLASDSLQEVVDGLCHKVMAFLDCQVFFNFLVYEPQERLQLNLFAGITEDEAKKIERFDFGMVVCDCAGQDVCRIVANNIPATPDPRTEVLKALGIIAYACHPLISKGKMLGTLSFGTRTRTCFSEEDLFLMKGMADQVAIAMERNKNEEELRKSEEVLRRAHEELEQRVKERTRGLVEALRELQQKEHLLLQQSRFAAMGEMINNIAHQWRQPLNSLGLNIQRLSLFYEKGVFDQELLNQSVTDAMLLINHMSGTIDDYRNFFKQDKEKMAFKVSEVITGAMKLVEASLGDNKINTKVDIQDDPLVIGYPNEYSQVVLNILINARDAFEKQRTAEPVLVIKTSSKDERSIVTITDNAGGIPPDVIFKVFDPHFTTKGPNGTGIGLFMAKNIIERNMNGKLSVQNTRDGAEFIIEV
ncbi:MAG TPA: PAS domain S-box protein [Desulfuromonadaceae bacterium]